ncbi:hypothetical protein [Nitrobacter sp. TKz-YC01]|uniref:hypothetical protein n=1 Tax=Nitrobacter sp. TKz-YC01 TaxID=3398703 RepID=UPI002B998E15|nr:hypothetical protein [Nitrobacter sp.]
MDIEFLKQQAERCRRLAKGTDPFTEKRLLKLAEEYEARIKELDRRNPVFRRGIRTLFSG